MKTVTCILVGVALVFFYTACTTSRVTQGDTLQSEDLRAHPSELLLELFEEESVEDLEERFSAWGLKLVRRVSPRQRYFLFNVDQTGLSSQEVLAKLTNDEQVKLAQWNKKLDRR